MVVITDEKYLNARVHTITVKNKELFWVRMKDVLGGLGLKNIPDLVVCVVCLKQKILQKNKKTNV